MCVIFSPVKKIETVFPYLVETMNYERILDIFKFYITLQNEEEFVPSYFSQTLFIKSNLLIHGAFLRNQVMRDMLDIVDK